MSESKIIISQSLTGLKDGIDKALQEGYQVSGGICFDTRQIAYVVLMLK